MHFAAFLDVGESVRDPMRVLPEQRGRRARACSRRWRRSRCRYFVFSSTCATYGEPIETPIPETHPQRPINSYGETKLAVERALPHFERAYGLRCGGAALLQRGGRRSGRRDRRGPLAGDSPHSARDRGGDRRARSAGVRRRLPDARRHLPARLHPRDGSGRRARAGARGDRRDRAVRRPTTWAPGIRIRCARSSTRSSASPGRRCRGRSAPRRPGDPAVLYAGGATRRRPSCGWTPRFPDLDSIVGTAWAWHRAHPHGYRADDADAPTAALVDPLLSVVMPAYNERDTIDEIIRRVLAVPIRIELDRRRRLLDRRHARRAAGAAARAGVHADAAAAQRRQGRGAAGRVRAGDRRHRRHSGRRSRVLAGGVSRRSSS